MKTFGDEDNTRQCTQAFIEIQIYNGYKAADMRLIKYKKLKK